MKFKIFLLVILLLGLILRGWQIDKFPKTLYGDEQAFAWNAYNILKLGQDEYGSSYPLQFRSFDDYKAPAPVYLLVPFFKIFGMNSLSIRFPIVIASVLTLIFNFLIANIFFNRKVSLLITFLFSVSPWHIHLTRGFFESTLSLFFFVAGVYFFIKSQGKLKLILISMLFFALTFYSYFTPRLLLPMFLPFLWWWKGNKSRNYIFGFLILIIILLPLLKLTFLEKGFSRFNKLTESMNKIVAETVRQERYATSLPQKWNILFHNKVSVWMRLIKNNYLEHLSPNFWYIYGDNSLRYFTGNMGMFYLVEFPFLVVGTYFLWKEKRNIAIFVIGWILLAAIPASLVGRPFAVRSLAILPAPFFIVGFGIYKLVRQARTILFSVILTIGFMFSLGSLLIRYYLEYPVYAATWWGWENKAALDYAKEAESQYDNIFISNFYTGATLAFAVYNQYDPLEYRYAINNSVTLADGRSLIKLGKYYFGSLDINKERLSQNIIPPRSLYIGRPEEADSPETINAPDDGRIIFKIYKIK